MFNILRKSIVLHSSFIKSFSLVNRYNPIVAVKQGKIQGQTKKLLNGEPYYSFKGIPYAEPPTGELRFKAPIPARPWIGTQDASKHGPVCPQYDIYTASTVNGDEDCLFLNIYTKSLEPSAKLPVMVYFHGGAYMSGSGNSNSYGPHFLIQHDVVLVTLNYRLEMLGFLCLNIPEAPGNVGMKDQVQALKWIKDNINQFGGDPDNVTIFGESAGAASVTYHMLSRMSEGLFEKAIAQSGVCTQDWAIDPDPVERAFRAAKLLGNDSKNVNELLNYLKTVPAIATTKMSIKTRTPDELFRGLAMHFVPVLEKKFDDVQNFLTVDPLDLLLGKEVNPVPFMVGYNSREGIVTVTDQIKKADVLNKHAGFLLPVEFLITLTKEKVSEFGEHVKMFYLGDEDISIDTVGAVIDMQTDRQFSYHSHRFAHLYSTLNIPTYLYVFDYETELNISKKLTPYNKIKGASHTDELFYIFSNSITRNMVTKQEELQNAIFKITKLWTDFAKYGNPTPDGTCEVKWKPYTQSGQEFLLIQENLTSGTHAYRDRIQFWDRLYTEAGLPSMSL